MTLPQPVDDAADRVNLRSARPADGSGIDGLQLTAQITAIDGVSLDGVAVRSLDAANPQDTAPRPLESRALAVQFAAVARAMASAPTVEATLQRMVEIARLIVPGCHHAGITVLRRGKPETPAATDEVSGEVDKVQYETGEGPCLSAIVERDTFRTGDLAEETRWPKFSRPAVERTGVRSVLAYRLFADGDTFGALNLYSRERDAFDDDAVGVGSILAAHAALAFARAREREQISGLEQAVASNRAIGMAIGILMAIRRVGQDEAFDLLRTVSQRTNRKLREIADDVVHTGQLPEPPAR
ncbi:MAG TPA: GAF and ANTAR domain-containing protein [Mycobacteriales bacterium]|nr:GAF and ANTAR domain-containing protein [Mycobacteriales bacterium]